MAKRTVPEQTREGHPMGPGLNLCILESDARGSSQVVRDGDGQNWAINVLEMRIISQEPISLIKARTLAKECGRRLGW
jgi:hypothetical protein